MLSLHVPKPLKKWTVAVEPNSFKQFEQKDASLMSLDSFFLPLVQVKISPNDLCSVLGRQKKRKRPGRLKEEEFVSPDSGKKPRGQDYASGSAEGTEHW